MSYPKSLEIDGVVRECHEVYIWRESVLVCNVVDESLGTNCLFDKIVDVFGEAIGAFAELDVR
jgi:hypothetical protein